MSECEAQAASDGELADPSTRQIHAFMQHPGGHGVQRRPSGEAGVKQSEAGRPRDLALRDLVQAKIDHASKALKEGL